MEGSGGVCNSPGYTNSGLVGNIAIVVCVHLLKFVRDIGRDFDIWTYLHRIKEEYIGIRLYCEEKKRI